MAAVVPEFDSRPGPVRDALARARHDWLALLEREVTHAQANGDLGGIPAPMLAFEIDALLAAANTTRNTTGSIQPLRTARALINMRLAATPGSHAELDHQRTRLHPEPPDANEETPAVYPAQSRRASKAGSSIASARSDP